MEQITMAEVVYVPVNPETHQPYRWGEVGEVCVSVFGAFWRCRRSPEAKGKQIMALAPEDLASLLERPGGAWADVTHVVYHPSADGYYLSRETVREQANAVLEE